MGSNGKCSPHFPLLCFTAAEKRKQFTYHLKSYVHNEIKMYLSLRYCKIDNNINIPYHVLLENGLRNLFRFA